MYFYALKYDKMKKLYSPFALRAAFVILLMLSFVRGWGQVTLPASSPYSQNFNTTPGASGTSYPTGWTSYNGTTNDGSMTVGNASSNSGANYNYANRIGLLGSNSAFSPGSIVLALSNTADKTSFKISYDVIKIREQTRSNSFNLEVSTTSATSGFTAIIGGAYTSGSLAEGTVTNYTDIDLASISNNATTVWIRWYYSDIGGSSSRDGIALDNVSLSWSLASTNDTTSEVDGPVLASQPNPVLISSLADTDAEAVKVFDFDIYDYGTADGLPTHVTQVTIKPGANNTANWANSIQNAKLSLNGGTTFVTTGTPVITAGSIVFPITSGNLDIADSDAETVSLFVYLKNSGLVDNSILEFSVPANAHGFTANSTGSTFATTFTNATVSNEMLIDVEASKLIVGTQPSATVCPNTNLTTAPVFRATDANNNIDTDFTSQVTVSNSGSLGMTNASLNAISGVATFTNLQFTATGTVTLNASATGIAASPASNSVVISVVNATGFSATNGNAQSVVGWTNPSCFDEVMIVAKAGSAVTAAPSGDGSAYTGNLSFSAGTSFDGGFVIYNGSASPQTLTNLINGTTYHLTIFTRKGTAWSVGATTTCTPNLASSSTDHFRTSKSGNWSDVVLATTPWQSSADNVNWITATLAPDTNASSVDILSGHHIVINTTGIVITKTQVFGSLEARGNNFSVNGIADEIELTIKDGGSFITNGDGYASTGNAYGLVETGGKLISFTGSGGDFAKNYLESTAGLFYFGNNSICEWQNTGSTLGAGYNNYFTAYENGDMPIFRIVNQPADPFGGTLSNVFNAKLEANANFSIRNAGTKTFIGGVIGTATVSQQATSGNLILGNGTNIPEIGGAVTLDVVAAKLKLPNGALVPAASNVIIKSSTQNNTFDREGGNLTIDGILDITNMRITNTATGGVIVNGTLKTANTGGLYGTDSAILSGNLTINDNSTIEYYATANQTISSAPTYYNVVFSGASIKSPVTDLTVNNITTVTAGTLQINETADNIQPHVFTAKKGLQNTGGTVLLANNANLLQDVDAANVGNVTMERKATVPSTQYNYWASPVKDQLLYGLYGAINMPDKTVKTYNTATDFFTNLLKSSNPTSLFGKGYSIKGPTNSTIAPYPITATFVGEPNNESTTPSENTTPLSTVGARYNLIGNPYPSNLNLVELYNANVGQFHIDGADTPTAYLWDNTGNTHLIQQGSEYANYATNNYATVNLSSGIGTSATSPTASVKKPNGIVRPGQGFIIKASAGATGLTFKNEDMRTSSIEMGGSNSEYFKNTSAPSNDNFWLTLTTPSNMNIVIAMSYNPNAENTFERFDSKIPNEAVTENFYSLSSDAKKLAIQSRKDFTTSDVVPLGIKSSKTEIQKISIDEKYGVFENQNIYLKDNLLNIVTNLSQGAYEFTAPIGINENRFEIVFEPSATLGTGATTKESLQVYRNGESFVVKSGQSKIDEVEVFDASGRLFQKVKGGSTEAKLDATVLPAGMYILKISRSNETISKKIIK